MNDLSCYLCSRSFKFRVQLKKHMQDKHGDIKFPCDICQRKFISRDDRNIHKESCHLQNVLKPRDINASTNNDKPIRTLQRTLEGDIECPTCDICSRSFKNCHTLKRHMRVTHSDNRAYSCDICGKAFKYKNNMQRHREVHVKREVYNCDKCSKTFISPCSLERHKKKVHSTEPPPLFPCNICGKTYGDRFNLKRHKKTHFPTVDECKNPPMVDESTKKCPTETEKENPRYKSFGEVDLEQTKLVIDESDNSTDNVFLKDKEKEKRYSCVVCGKRFARSEYLRRHKKVHTDKRVRYHCHKCEKTYTRNYVLREHIQRVHGRKPSNDTVKAELIHFDPSGTSNGTNTNIFHPESKFLCQNEVSKGNISLPVDRATAPQTFLQISYEQNLNSSRQIAETVAPTTANKENGANFSRQNCEKGGKKVVFECKRCSNVYADLTGLRRHSKKKHTLEVTCWFCHKVMVKEDILKQHLETIHDKTLVDNLAAGSSLNTGVEKLKNETGSKNNVVNTDMIVKSPVKNIQHDRENVPNVARENVLNLVKDNVPNVARQNVPNIARQNVLNVTRENVPNVFRENVLNVARGNISKHSVNSTLEEDLYVSDASSDMEEYINNINQGGVMEKGTQTSMVETAVAAQDDRRDRAAVNNKHDAPVPVYRDQEDGYPVTCCIM